MLNKLIKDYLIMIIGGIVIGVGVAFVVYGNIGGDSMTTFEQGLSITTHMSLPTAQLIANGLFVVILLFLDRKRVNLDTVLCPLFISLGCKLAISVLPTVEGMVLRAIYFAIGLIIVGAGIGIGAQSDSGSNPYDGTVLALSEKTKISFSTMRPIMDGILLVIGVLLKGSWGVGTVIAILATGSVANVFIKLFGKLK